jgi:hypothetical protein
MYLTTRAGRRRFALAKHHGAWWLERWSPDGLLVETMALDYDARHRRLFLSEVDERRVGVAGIEALERLARRALGGRG